MTEFVFLINVDGHRITGGVRFIYRIANALHQNGFSVAISSLSNGTPKPISGEPLKCKALTLQQTADLPPNGRVLVLPDDLVMRHNNKTTINGIEIDLTAGNFVLLSQGRRDIMKSFTDIWPKRTGGQSVANHQKCLGFVTVSTHEHEIWQAIYPNLMGWVVPNSVDCDVFTPLPKTRTIVFTEKGRTDTVEVRKAILLIRHAQLLKGYAFKRLHGLSQPGLATELGNASVFLSGSPYESFGLLACEAIASGCIFAGSDGGAHASFLSDEWAYRSAPCDTLGLIKSMQRLDYDLINNPDSVDQKRFQGRAFVAANCTPDQQISAACKAFKEVTERLQMH